jgi:Zn-dependent metalloprotease
MKYSIVSFLVLLSFSILAQNKKSEIPIFKNPFSQKTKASISKPIIAPLNNGSLKLDIRNGSFFKSVDSMKISIEDLKKSFNTFFNVGSDYEFRELSLETDKLNFTHAKYQQLYKNLIIEGAEVIIHSKSNMVTTVNGKLANFSKFNIEPKIDINTAKYNALNKFDSKDVRKIDSTIGLTIIKLSENSMEFKLAYKFKISLSIDSIYFVYIDAINGKNVKYISLVQEIDVPGTANTIYNGTKSITNDSYSGNYRLRESNRGIQTFNMNQGTNYSAATDFVNSSSNWAGANLILDTFKVSSVSQSWWYSNVSDVAPELYIKVLDGSNTVVYTSGFLSNTFPPLTFYNLNINLTNPPYTVEVWDYDVVGSNDFGGSYLISDTVGMHLWQGNGNNGNYNIKSTGSAALDAHWGMEKTYDFYLSQFNRNSYDNAGAIIKNYVHTDINYSNANWNSSIQAMSYGDGDGITMGPVLGLDIVGHEFSHAVITNSANLIYQSESGALNESFADIFGTAIEFYAGNNPNWTLGEGVYLLNPFVFRTLSNPNIGSSPQPDTYQGTYWVNPLNFSYDNGGVHTNSGVQNFWFYLVCQGGIGTNDIGNGYSVTGIGIAKAQQIAYRNLTTYLTSSSNYYDSYLGSLQATQDLYGNPSAEYTAVQSAWYAVGIGNSTNAYCSGTTTYTNTTGSITDGSGTANYLDNSNCKWLIKPAGATQITLNFTSFSTEANYDTVFVYDGPSAAFPLLATWWGNTLPPTLISTGGAMFIRFTSDISNTDSGWAANYTSLGTTPSCSGGNILSNSSGTISDGSGTSNYGNNQLCYWTIAPPCATSVTFSFSTFSTEASYDGVIIFDDLGATNQIGVYSGNTIPANVTSNTGVMVIVFVSDYATTLQGFSGSYTSIGSGYCSSVSTLNTNDNGIISDGSGTNKYCNNQNCEWLIQPPQATSVSLSFNSFDLEPKSADGFTIYDAVEIYDGINSSAPLIGKFTGNAIPPYITSSGGSLFIKFYSDLGDNYQGWEASYTSTTNNYCNGLLDITAPFGNINDGSGANKYGNNANCSWYIHPSNIGNITLNFIAFSLEQNNDAVIVYDGGNNNANVIGQYSGTTIPSSITSTSNELYLEFITDNINRFNGWSANYNSNAPTNVSNKNLSKDFNIYPNPSNDNVYLEIPSALLNNSKIEIFNAMGQIVWESNVENKKSTKVLISISNFSNGVYSARLTNNNYNVSKKFIIAK